MNTQNNLVALLQNVVTNRQGFSYNLTTGETNPTTGYMVAIDQSSEGRRHQLSVPIGADIMAEGKQFVTTNAEVLTNPRYFVGVWVDTARNRVVFDVSMHIDSASLATALWFAEINNQEAIWDCAHKVEIYLEPKLTLLDAAIASIEARLEELRAILRSETMSYDELVELQSLAEFIDPSDTELLEAADVPETKYPFNEGDRYFTVEGKDVIESVWDDVSEEAYDETKRYYSSLDEVLQNIDFRPDNIYRLEKPNDDSVKIEEAKQFLKSKGYFTDFLWHVDDVKLRYPCDDETAQKILRDANQHEALGAQMWMCIDDAAEVEGLERIDSN
jgi:hypothetical protein